MLPVVLCRPRLHQITNHSPEHVQGAKMDMFSDARDKDLAEKEADTMDTWDQAKLEDVVILKGKKSGPRTETDIVCKFFLEALEDRKYGWFWACPNGGDTCMYRHALPQGYVLKRDIVKEEKEEITIEELIDSERAALGPTQTKVTLDSFLKWKAKKIADKKELLKKEIAAKKRSIAAKDTISKGSFFMRITGTDPCHIICHSLKIVAH